MPCYTEAYEFSVFYVETDGVLVHRKEADHEGERNPQATGDRNRTVY